MTQEPPSQGLIAGKYQLVRMIGKGGMGSVWEAKHVSLGTSSAIKFIESDYADSSEARVRFDKEARAAATIQSKHAIQIFDHGVTEDGRPYIVMELLQGEPLDKVIDRQRLSLQETAKILQQVARGLARAHERGIVHRDLKPENIYLVRTPDEDEPVAKVLDFGIAKMKNDVSSGLSSSTKTGAVLGTPFYMAPEQARGLRNVDHRADIWSLGVIAFKCLTGKLPFDGESIGDLLVKICTAPVPVPSHMYPGIPPNFDAWFMRALEREPDRRFATVTEQADALCFTAGIASRAQGGGALAGTAIAPGAPGPFASSPSGYGGGMAPSSPSSPGSPSNYGPPPPFPGATPAPGAMTNAPFTSESIPGVPTRRSKALLAIAGVGIVGVVAVGLFFARDRIIHADTTQAAGLAPAVASVSVPPTAEHPPDPPPSATAPALPTSAPTSAPGGGGAVAPKPTPRTTPKAAPTPAKTAPTREAVTPPPLPVPAPNPKKPNKNDPGY